MSNMNKTPLPQLIWLPFDPYASAACYFVNFWLVHVFVLIATFFFTGDMVICDDQDAVQNSQAGN